MDEALDMPQTGIGRRDFQGAIDIVQRKGCAWRVERGDRLVQHARRVHCAMNLGDHAWSAKLTPLAPMTAATTSRSRCPNAGAQRSMISTTRSWSLSFHASCSIVSSN